MLVQNKLKILYKIYIVEMYTIIVCTLKVVIILNVVHVFVHDDSNNNTIFQLFLFFNHV